MAVDTETGRHIPKNSMLFEFDDEVIAIFDNMSRRSICGYDHAYQMIKYFASRHPWPKTGSEVWDFGTTRGKALQIIREGAGLSAPYINFKGLDVSEASIKTTGALLPWADIYWHDLQKGAWPDPEAEGLPVHMAVFGYTMMFLEDLNLRKRLIRQVYERMAPGGLLFVLEQYEYSDPLVEEVARDAYLQFRRDNGYTLEEITKKSEALKNAMWRTPPEFMQVAMKEAGFSEVHVLYRDLTFGGLMASK